MPRVSKLIGTFSKTEISALFKKAKRIRRRHPNVDILCAPSLHKDFGKILVITPKKIGKANKRNLIRRRLKSIFYEEKLYKNLLDCIVIVKKDALGLSFDQLKTLLKESISKKRA